MSHTAQSQRSWDPPPPWVFSSPGGVGWARAALDGAPPIETITPDPLWGADWPPAPPQIDRQPPAADPNHLVMPSPLPGGPMAGLYMQFPQRSEIEDRSPKLSIQHPQMPEILPNDRHPVTGAPIRNPDLPSGVPLPPGQVGVVADGQHPITGAPIRGGGGGGNLANSRSADGPASYPWRHHEREETAPLPPLGGTPTVQGEVAQPEPPPDPQTAPAPAPVPARGRRR